MSNMLESYSLDFKGKKNGLKEYKFSFKVATDVIVSFNQVGDVNEIHLKKKLKEPGGNQHKNYNISGPLDIQIFEDPAAGVGKDGGNVADAKPKVVISVEP